MGDFKNFMGSNMDKLCKMDSEMVTFLRFYEPLAYRVSSHSEHWQNIFWAITLHRIKKENGNHKNDTFKKWFHSLKYITFSYWHIFKAMK